MHRKIVPLLLIALTAIILSACNLGAGNPAQETLQASTLTPTTLGLPTRTPATTSGAPTTLPLTTNPTRVNPQIPPTAIVVLPPTNRPLPTNTFVPVNIVILSPFYGNVVAGAVQVFGSATHPNFLQYQLEYGPDPNPNNLWYPATTASTVPVTNGILGFWNTTGVQDATYQLRLRVFLRDGTLLTTVVNNIRVQNRQATPIPSNTPLIERPIAAFNVDKSAGQVPLTVNFTNQSSGQINTIQWDFGDGTGSTVANPSHTYSTPGLYTATLTVTGPGGTANVSRQINVQSPSAPIAGFTMDRTTGVAPLTIQFTDQSTGTITSYLWNFLDGTTSTDRNPSHQFTLPGTYNILLTVTGPGGSSTATRQITVTSPIPPTLTFTPTFTFTPIPPTATFTPTNTETPLPPTLTFTPTNTDTPAPIPATATPTETPPVSAFTWGVPDPANPLLAQFFNQSTGSITSYQWDFGDGTGSNELNPFHQYSAPGTYLVTLYVTTASGLSNASQQNVTVVALPTATWTPSETSIPPTETSVPPTETPPVSSFVWNIPDPANPLLVQFTSQASGNNLAYAWNFGDGGTSNEIHPVHQYNAPGTYVVSLIVTSSSGLSNESVQQVTVVALPTAEPTATETPTETPPVSAFTWSIPDPANPLLVQFVSQSTGNNLS
ncbi:MAG: PKD domain-containing protein, partial [Anaerolinea sp.]|nr:PKD domain-containing protein [Anaerolinea sp.]